MLLFVFGSGIKGRPKPIGFRSLFIPFFLLLLSSRLAFAADASYLPELLEKARARQLAAHPYWHTLVHYKLSFMGTRSLVDDPDFFLSPKGKRDPEAELEATLRAFFEPTESETKHPVCRFVARYHWLKEELQIDPTRLPEVPCTHFENLMADIQPESVSLIFPAAYMNSPASMFGHTLLLLEPEADSKLLSHAVNYAAVTPDTFGPFFAFKGLFGLYEGYFSVLPYYAKIQQYSDVDHRDIWEYRLNLNREEIRRLMMHLYEMDFIHSNYYFFTENCSYTLLFLLDAARPGLDLTDQFSPLYVIPKDTIEAVEENELITERVFRPSRTTKIRHLADQMPTESRRLATAIADGQSPADSLAATDLPVSEQILVMDLAAEYVRYRYTRNDIEQPVFQKRYLDILRVRSPLGNPPDDEKPRIEPPVPPEDGHRPGRFGLAGGVDDGDGFLELRVRPANHELIDDERGFQEGSQIIFGEAALRYFPSEDRLQLHRLNVIDILSISPRDELFQPISWKAKTGLTRKILEDADDHLVWELGAGGGLAYSSDLFGLWYLLLESDLNLGGALEDSYAVGIGASTGIVRRINDFWKIHLFANDIEYLLGDTRNAFKATLQQSFTLNAQMSVSADVTRRREHDIYRTEAVISFNIYF